MKVVVALCASLVLSTTLSRAQVFSDNFTRGADPGPLAPWSAQSGTWTVTGGVLQGGLNSLQTYGLANLTNSYVNYSAQARIKFPAGAFGGGLGARLNPANGTRYAAWIYPENSPGGSNVLKLIKFQDYSTFGYNGASFVPIVQTNLPAVGTNFHTLRLDVQGTQLTAYFDGTSMLRTNDIEASPLLSGTVDLEFWTDASAYLFTADDVVINLFPPTAGNDSYSSTVGTTLAVSAPGVLANDGGGSGPLTALLATNAAHGVLVLSNNGGFTYTATNNFTGTDTFSYRASDGQTNSSPAVVTITVSPNHPPVATSDNYSVVLNTSLTVSAPGVLGNDSDQDGNNLTAVQVSGVTNGTLTLNPNGGFLYVPTPGFVGSDGFTYRASDGLTNSAVTPVSISVLPAVLFTDDFTRGNDPGPITPWIADSGNWTVTAGAMQTSSNAPFGYSYAHVTNSWTDYSVQARVRFATNGFGGGIGGRFNPATGSHYAAWVYPEGSAGGGGVVRLIKFQSYNSFSYHNTGGPMQTANLSGVGTNWHTLKLAFFGTRVGVYFDGELLISMDDDEATSYGSGGVDAEMWTDASSYAMSVDDVIVSALAADDVYAANEDALLTVSAPGVLGNDSGVYSTNLSAVLVSGVSHGALNLSTNGSFTYIGATNFNGADSFTYRLMDGATNLGTATVSLNVVVMNDAPVLGSQPNRTIAEQSALTVTNLATDSDVPAQTLTYALINPPNGASINSSGVISWTPSESQGPNTFNITTRVTDSGSPSRSATNTFTVTVTEVNVAPVLPNVNNRTITELSTLSIPMAATDADLPANSLSYSLLNAPANASISGSGLLTWTPNETQGPSTNLFSVRVVDNGSPALSATNTFTVVVNETNSAPVLPGIANRLVLPGNLLSITNSATDSDIPVNSLSYNLLTAPAGAAIDPVTGIITWTPSIADDPSTNTFTTVVTDFNPDAPSNQHLSQTNSFIVTVSSRPIIGFNLGTLMAEGCGPTNNAVDPGEVVNMTFSFKNLGLGPATNLEVTLLATNGVTLPGPAQQYGSVPAGGTSADQSFSFTAAGTCGGNIIPTFRLRDGDLELGMVTTTVSLGQLGPIFSENFDSAVAPALPPGWTTAHTGAQADWRTTNSIVDTAPNCVFATDGGAPGINELVSPPIPLPLGPAQLSFRHRYALESGGGTNAFDGGILEMALNGSTTFVNITNAGGIFLSNGYNGKIDGRWNNPLAGQSAWHGTNSNFITSVVSLPPAASGQTVQFRWRVGTDASNPGGGWRIDSIIVSGSICCAHSAPVLPAQTDRSVNELANLSVTNTAIAGPGVVLSYSLLQSPAGMQITTNGVITWTPDEGQGPGSYQVRTVVTDNGTPALSATNSFQVNVAEVNLPPVLPAQTNRTVAELELVTVTNTAGDPDIPTNLLSYSLVNAPAGMTIDASGVISWLPAEAQGPSTNVITTIVSDDGVPALSATNSFILVVGEVNNSPLLSQPSDQTIAELTPLIVKNAGLDSDIPANSLSYSLINSPSGASIDLTGKITWTPTEAQGPSTNTLTTVVTDNGNPPLSATNSFIVVVTEANTAPVLPSQPDRTIASDSVLIVTNSAVDSDLPANTVSYQLLNGPPGMAVNPNGIITWSASTNDAGTTNLITTVASDDGIPALSATNEFRLVVLAVGAAPAPIIQTLDLLNGQAVLTWSSVSGHVYRVEYKDDSRTGAWSNIEPDIAAQGAVSSVTNSVDAISSRYFRVELLP